MPDGILSIGTSFDKSSLEGGFTDAQALTKSAMEGITMAIESSHKKTREAIKNMSADIVAHSSTVTAESLKIAEGFKLQSSAAADLRRAITLTKDSTVDSALSTNLLAAALEKQRLAADHAAESMARVVPEAIAASGEFRVLEGAMPVRAAERFATTVLGLGPILQNAFPIFGAVAFGEMVVEVGKKMYEAFDLGGERARQTEKDIRSDTDSLTMMNDELVVQADKLEIANAKLEHRPVSGARLAIDEAVLAAERLNEKLDASLKKIEATIKGMAASGTQQFLTMGMAGAGTGYEQTMAAEHARHLDEAKTEQDKLNESISFSVSLTERLGELQRWQERGGGPGIEVDYNKEIAATRHLIAMQEQEQRVIRSTIEIDKEQAKHGGDIGNTKGKQPNYEEILAVQQLEQGKSLGATVLFWENVVKTTGEHHEQLLHAEEEFQRQLAEPSKLRAELAKGHKLDEQPMAVNWAAIAPKNAELALDEAIGKSMEQQVRFGEKTYESALKLADLKERLGLISSSAAAKEETAASNAEQDKTVGDLKGAQQQIAPMGPMGLDDKTLALWNSLQDKITAAQQRGADQRFAITQREALREQQQFQKMFQSITTPMNTFFDHWLTSGKNMGQAAQKMAGEIAMNFINADIKMLEHHLATEIQKRFITVTSNTAQVASTAAAGAATVAINKSTAVQSIAGKAADAAAGAWNALSNIPVVGPVLGAAAAAATYIGIMSLAAFEQGGIVQGGGRMGVPILAHAGERVLSASQTEHFEQMVNQSTSTSSSAVHFHDHSNFTGIDGASVANMARSHGQTWRRETMRQLRLANKV